MEFEKVSSTESIYEVNQRDSCHDEEGQKKSQKKNKNKPLIRKINWGNHPSKILLPKKL